MERKTFTPLPQKIIPTYPKESETPSYTFHTVIRHHTGPVKAGKQPHN